jgi:hypothetical protein
MSTLPGIPSTHGERTRREAVRFRDRDQAYELTTEALHNVGFDVERRVPERDTRSEWRAQGKPGTLYGSEPELTATYQDPRTGNTVELGLTVTSDMRGPYDWSVVTYRHPASGQREALGETGNHDNNQHEFRDMLTHALSCAYFDVHEWDFVRDAEGYDEWEAATREALDPLMGCDS